MDNRRNELNLKLINMEQVEVEKIDWLIYQTAEDGLGDTIKPRLLAAGADCSRVMVIDDNDQAFLGADVDMHRANEIRPLMKRVAVLAEKISLCDCSDWSYE